MVTRRGVIVLLPETSDKGETSHSFRVEEAFGNFPAGNSEKLSCKPSDAEFVAMGPHPSPNAVLKAGQRLYDVLNKSAGVQKLFAQMDVGVPPAGTSAESRSYPLFVKVEDPPGPEELPWEVLWEQQRDFFALDPHGRWPVARLVASNTRPVRLVKTIEPMLKVALVLAAADEREENEWECFKTAVSVLQVPIQILVLVSDESLKTRVDADLAKWKPNAVSGAVDFVGDQDYLLKRLVDFAPNIIHFFCHGRIDAVAQLDLETRIGRTTGSPQRGGSIVMRAADLRPVIGLRSLWLIVLNCCSSGKSTSILHSIAKSLVSDAVPAVVAMREPIQPDDANFFTKHFYQSLLSQLNEIVGMVADPHMPNTSVPLPELVWMRATDAARRELSHAFGRVAATDSQWTYPVLYLYRGEVCVEELDATTPQLPVADKAQLEAHLRALNVFLEGMRAGVDDIMDEKRAELAAAIRGIETQLRIGQVP
jgi:hypothetical protein